MFKLTLGMITRNEEFYLSKILPIIADSFDEIVVVDSESTDGTPDVLRRFGALVITRKWNNDFASARNTVIANSTGDWCFMLDADEAMFPADIKLLRDKFLDKAVAITLPWYEFAVDHQHWRPEVYPDMHTRIFKLDTAVHWRNRVHEQLYYGYAPKPMQVSGDTLFVPSVHVYHYGHCKLPRLTRLKIINYNKLLSGLSASAETACTDNSELGIVCQLFSKPHPLAGLPTMLECGLF